MVHFSGWENKRAKTPERRCPEVIAVAKSLLHSKPLNESYSRGYNSDAHSPGASKWQPVHLNNHPA
jgi:hypothetical protein